MMALPALPTWHQVCERLCVVFPEGTENRNYCIRDTACKTVFVMLYIGAVEGTGRWLAPKHVYRMSDDQAAKTDLDARNTYAKACKTPGFKALGAAWYADTSREPIRDETLKEGLVTIGAVVVREGLPTTSSKGRYALQESFSRLFDPTLKGDALASDIEAWQEKHLSPAALARVKLVSQGVVAGAEGILVTFPNGETRRMASGPSSVISKAVIEEFAPEFLEKPGVIFLSESRNHVVTRDDELAKILGLSIQADKHLPDLILVDLGPTPPLLVFVEVVATDGPVTESRRKALEKIATNAGLSAKHVAFVTAFADRNLGPFKKSVPVLAWSSFAWLVSEPDNIIQLHQLSDRKAPVRLIDMIVSED